MDYFLGIDIGTSGVKALIIDEKGKVIGSGLEEIDVITPQPLWVEQQPDKWWSATCKAIAIALKEDISIGTKIKSIGITGQMLGTVLLDKDFIPLMNSIIWLDQRAVEENNYIEEIIGLENLLEYTSNIPLTGYWAQKILWIRKNLPHIFDNVYKIVFPKDYIRYILTGELSLEVSDLGGSYLFDVRKRAWSDKMFKLLSISKDIFPQTIHESEDIAGYLKDSVAKELHLQTGIPVIAGGGDQTVGAIGNGAVKEGVISVSIGTSGVVFACTDKAYVDYNNRSVFTYCHSIRNKWCIYGCTLSAGGSLKWLTDNFAVNEKELSKKLGKNPYILMDKSAEKAKPGCEGLVFLPYLNGERSPYPDPNARAVFFGYSLRHSWPETVRSVMEGITFSLKDIIEIMKEYNLNVKEVIVSGGGARSKFWRQMQADIFDAEVVTVNLGEGPGGGAAILAAVGAGYFKNVAEACSQLIQPITTTEPIRGNVEVYKDIYNLYNSLYPALNKMFARHGEVVNKWYREV